MVTIQFKHRHDKDRLDFLNYGRDTKFSQVANLLFLQKIRFYEFKSGFKKEKKFTNKISDNFAEFYKLFTLIILNLFFILI